jgi:hypothetical protein
MSNVIDNSENVTKEKENLRLKKELEEDVSLIDIVLVVVVGLVVLFYF